VSFLSQNDVCSCAAVSSRWREAASADTIWQHFTNIALCGELGAAAGAPALIAAVYELLSTEYFEITQDLFGLARRTQDRLQSVVKPDSGDAAAAIYASCRSWRRFCSTYVFTDSCIISSLGSSCSTSSARTPSSSCGPASSSSSSAAAAAAVVAPGSQAAVQLEAIRKAARQRQAPEAAKRAGCQLLQLYAATARSAAVAERHRASACSSSSSRGSSRGSIRFSSNSSSSVSTRGAAAAARSRLAHFLKRDVLPGAVLAVVAALYVDCCSVLLHEAHPAPSATVTLSTAALPVSMLRLLKCYLQFYERARLRVGLHGLKPSHGAQIVVVYDDDENTDAADGTSTAVLDTAATADSALHSEVMISDSAELADGAEMNEKQGQRSVTIGCSHGAVTEALQFVHSDPFHGPAPTVSAHFKIHCLSVSVTRQCSKQRMQRYAPATTMSARCLADYIMLCCHTVASSVQSAKFSLATVTISYAASDRSHLTVVL
jgi:F-box-like